MRNIYEIVMEKWTSVGAWKKSSQVKSTVSMLPLHIVGLYELNSIFNTSHVITNKQSCLDNEVDDFHIRIDTQTLQHFLTSGHSGNVQICWRKMLLLSPCSILKAICLVIAIYTFGGLQFPRRSSSFLSIVARAVCKSNVAEMSKKILKKVNHIL